jgi:non-homologous end joining protein Ku
MPARPAWKGQLRLALVSIPVEFKPAAHNAPPVEFRQIHRKTARHIRGLLADMGLVSFPMLSGGKPRPTC